MKKLIFKKKLKSAIKESCHTKEKITKEIKSIEDAIILLKNCLKNKNKILICGNGGSAADAQHLAAEFLVRLRPKINRDPFPVLSLAQDTSTITACSNDFNFNKLFSRTFKALYKTGDVLLIISTSGNSKNIIEVAKVAKKKKIKIVGFLGNKGGDVLKYIDVPIIIKSKNTARIQESHIFIGHFIFEQVENYLIRK